MELLYAQPVSAEIVYGEENWPKLPKMKRSFSSLSRPHHPWRRISIADAGYPEGTESEKMAKRERREVHEEDGARVGGDVVRIQSMPRVSKCVLTLAIKCMPKDPPDS